MWSVLGWGTATTAPGPACKLSLKTLMKSLSLCLGFRNCGGSFGTFYGRYCQYLSCLNDANGTACRYTPTFALGLTPRYVCILSPMSRESLSLLSSPLLLKSPAARPHPDNCIKYGTVVSFNFCYMCSGNGQCLSLREIAPLTYNERKEVAGFVYTDPWDAE